MKFYVFCFLFWLSSIAFAQTQTGKASFYADKFEGKQTASGEIYKHNLPTAAHRKLAFGSKVKVTNLQNYKTAMVTINDRGPFIRGRIIDLSRSVAQTLDILDNGVTEVKIEVLKNQDVNVTSASTSTSPSTPQTPIAKPTTNKDKTNNNSQMQSIETFEEKEFYEINIDEITPDFFGVQIASFQDTDNLLRMVNRLKVNYNSKVLVQVKTVSGSRVYTLILGQYKSRKAAENFQSRMLNKYPDSFIVDMTIKD
ncbi:rare lipoprotein A precursor with SPOR superfamily domain [Psychroflexus torquis ATCC 700755]|uniref:Probable endolytic peptidoglycan transglycosylase RlpA n=1 Tax=Psychroflexus torquis (strain ATCC 700755 / CIP 106069 / ACAM 623) TaxID=313595 RepID=K4IJ96_PSYTT|nr:septal ring lytic transglycosylase RlpA family protein [Psychroflexus torquis]AFU70424.1 rare lipoprotein A precursor with SPOR superfamily domain [Psychroflexus torquis ATCC 700755]